jgi:hypothetical protein
LIYFLTTHRNIKNRQRYKQIISRQGNSSV